MGRRCFLAKTVSDGKARVSSKRLTHQQQNVEKADNLAQRVKVLTAKPDYLS